MIFQVRPKDTFDIKVEDNPGEKNDRFARESPYRGYLRHLKTTEDDNVYKLEFDLEITDMGYELLDRNPAKAEDWIQNRYDRSPDGFQVSDTNDIQKQLESIQKGEFHASIKINISGGTFTQENITQLEVRGYERITVQGMINTEDVLTVSLDDYMRLIIDTTEI